MSWWSGYTAKHGPVYKGAFYLDVMQPWSHAREDVPVAQQGLAVLHQIGNGMLTIADAFLELGSDEGNGFVEVQLQSPREPLLGQGTCLLSNNV